MKKTMMMIAMLAVAVFSGQAYAANFGQGAGFPCSQLGMPGDCAPAVGDTLVRPAVKPAKAEIYDKDELKVLVLALIRYGKDDKLVGPLPDLLSGSEYGRGILGFYSEGAAKHDKARMLNMEFSTAISTYAALAFMENLPSKMVFSTLLLRELDAFNPVVVSDILGSPEKLKALAILMAPAFEELAIKQMDAVLSGKPGSVQDTTRAEKLLNDAALNKRGGVI